MRPLKHILHKQNKNDFISLLKDISQLIKVLSFHLTFHIYFRANNCNLLVYD